MSSQTIKNVSLLYGGVSGEHEVSIQTAFSILQRIDYAKFSVTPIYISKNGEWFRSETLNEVPSAETFGSRTNEKLGDLLSYFKHETDVVFPVIHGPNGEDGTVQGLLELCGVPYVGSGVFSSAAGMDKVYMKRFFAYENLPQCKYVEGAFSDYATNQNAFLHHLETTLSYPYFVKPANLGSSVGISKVRSFEEGKVALDLAFSLDQKIVVEEAVDAREIEVGVLGNEALLFSSIGEISTDRDFYDYDAKYVQTSGNTLTIPSAISPETEQKLLKMAEKAYRALGCQGLSRIDFFLDRKTDELFLNEINTMPGFTEHSMYPMLFAHAGIAYSELISRLIELAFERATIKSKQQENILQY